MQRANCKKLHKWQNDLEALLVNIPSKINLKKLDYMAEVDLINAIL